MIFKPPKDYRHKEQKEQKTIVRLEQWAQAHKVNLQKIPEEPGKKTPDYKAIFPDSDKTIVIIEVKEILAPFQVDPKTGVMEILEKESPGNGSTDGEIPACGPSAKQNKRRPRSIKSLCKRRIPDSVADWRMEPGTRSDIRV